MAVHAHADPLRQRKPAARNPVRRFEKGSRITHALLRVRLLALDADLRKIKCLQSKLVKRSVGDINVVNVVFVVRCEGHCHTHHRLLHRVNLAPHRVDMPSIRCPCEAKARVHCFVKTRTKSACLFSGTPKPHLPLSDTSRSALWTFTLQPNSGRCR